MERFIRNGILAAIAGGLLLAAGAAVTYLTTGHQQFADQVLTGAFTTSAALRFTGAILITWGIVSLYLRQADAAGRLGLIAIVACLANMALQLGWMFCDLFAAPSFAHAAPGVLNNTTGPLTVGFLIAWIGNVSFVLLGIATWRARVLPRTSALALVIAGAITVVPLPGDGSIYEVIIGLALGVAGARALPKATRAPLPAQSAAEPRDATQGGQSPAGSRR
jgi:hypothetical protein